MSHYLSEQSVTEYRERGCLYPVPVLSDTDAKRLRHALEAIEQQQGHPLDKAQCNKSYLLYDWADELVHHPAIVDAVASLIGEDIICLMTNLFIKEAGSLSYVSMHQDAAYWGVDADDVVTAWVALSPATAESGVMKVEPGSHFSLRTQVNTYARDNLLSRGQEIPAEELEPAAQEYMALKPGEMSLHHFRLVHGSDANTSDDRRIGFAIRYVAAKDSVRVENQSGLLVRGQNRSNIQLEQRTQGMTSKQKAKEHAKAMRLLIATVFKPEKGAAFSEVVRLKVTECLGIALSYWKQFTG